MDKLLFYVDDDPQDLATFLYAAKSHDVEVKLFKNGQQILEQLKHLPKPFAIFIDLNMPPNDGYELIKTIKDNKEFEAIPIIAFSTASNERSMESAKAAGATCYISKPATIAKFKSALHLVITNDWHSFDKERNFLINY